ncbi:MAG: hypothetical protein AABY22_04715 [Nanoarchaeota archaeon]
MGTIIKFRYQKPVREFNYNPIKTILVLTSNYNGNLHGLDIRGLSPLEQQMFQYLFEAAQTKQRTGNPIANQIIEKQKQLKIAEQGRNELLQKKNAVVVTPDPNQTKKTFSISTFKRTPVVSNAFETVSRFMTRKDIMTPQQIQQELQKSEGFITRTQQEIQRFQQIMNMYSQFDRMNAIPKDPYSFYHNYIKPNFGARTSTFYRKFSVQYVQNARIVKGVYSQGTL